MNLRLIRSMAALASLAGVSAAWGATATVAPCTLFPAETCASAVTGVVVGTTTYNVSFPADTFGNLNTGGNFPFVGLAGQEPNAEAARDQILAALEAAGATRVGATGSAGDPYNTFWVPYGDPINAGVNILTKAAQYTGGSPTWFAFNGLAGVGETLAYATMSLATGPTDLSFSSAPLGSSYTIQADPGGDSSSGSPVDVTGLPKFNPALGTLTGISFSVTSGNFQWDATLDGSPLGGEPYAAEFSASIQADVVYVTAMSGDVVATVGDSYDLSCDGPGDPGNSCSDNRSNDIDFGFVSTSIPKVPGDFGLADIVGSGDIQNFQLGIGQPTAFFNQNEGLDPVYVSGTADIIDATVQVSYTYLPSGPVLDAVDDGPVSVTEGVAQIIPVGANDTGFSNPVTVTITTFPNKGTIGAISPSGPAAGMTITYTANVGTVGADSFEYQMADGTPASDTATVTIDISPDTDGDSLPDSTDNCTQVSNVSQCDSDGDGYGNRCDGDMNNNGFTNSQDYILFRQQLGQPSDAPTYNEADMNCNGFVNSQDYILFRSRLGIPSGPSGLHP